MVEGRSGPGGSGHFLSGAKEMQVDGATHGTGPHKVLKAFLQIWPSEGKGQVMPGVLAAAVDMSGWMDTVLFSQGGNQRRIYMLGEGGDYR